MLNEEFKNWCLRQGYPITEGQMEQFSLLQENLLDWNKRMNLTAITGDRDIWQKHFADSLTLLPFLWEAQGVVHGMPGRGASQCVPVQTTKLIDIGTGAGFPGLPVKIMRPDIDITLLDSLGKRITFLEDTIARLGFDDRIRCINARAENLIGSDEHRGRYHVAFARAVARLGKLCKWSLPFLAHGGFFFAMKGPEIDDEVREAQPVIRKLGGEVVDVKFVEIVPGMVHSVVVVRFQ